MYDKDGLVGREAAKIMTAGKPDPAALASAPVADLWDCVYASRQGRTGLVLVVSGDVAHASQWLTAIDVDWKWVMTPAGFHRLGWPADAFPPIVQAAMQRNRMSAHELCWRRTGLHTLPMLVSQHAATYGELYILAVAETLRKHGRLDAAAAWDLLSVEGDHAAAVEAAARALAKAVHAMVWERDRTAELKTMLQGWQRMAARPPQARGFPLDPIQRSHEIGGGAVPGGRTGLEGFRISIRADEPDEPKGTLH